MTVIRVRRGERTPPTKTGTAELGTVSLLTVYQDYLCQALLPPPPPPRPSITYQVHRDWYRHDGYVGGLEVQLPDRCVLIDTKTTCPGTGRSREGEGGGWVAAGLLPHCTAD